MAFVANIFKTKFNSDVAKGVEIKIAGIGVKGWLSIFELCVSLLFGSWWEKNGKYHFCRLPKKLPV